MPVYKIGIFNQNRGICMKECVNMSGIEKLPDLLLVETYYKALAIDVEPKFIEFV